MVIWQIIIFLLSFVVSGLIVGVVLRHFFRDKVLSLSESIILGLGFGPIIISMILYLAFFLFPSKANLFYVLLIGLIFLSVGVILRRQFKLYLQQIYQAFQDIKLSNFKLIAKDKILIIIFVLLVGFYIFYQGVSTAISSNDGCTYGQIGRYLYDQKNINNYPFSSADSKTGFFVNGAQHPPALPLIYTWNFLMQGNSQNDILARVVSPLYALYLALLLFLVLRKRGGLYSGVFGLLLLTLTPIMIWQSYSNSIDPIRFFAIFASLVILGKIVEFKEAKLIILLGIVSGLSLYMHATGILVFLVILATYLILAGVPLKQRLLGVVVIASLALLAGGIPYTVSYVRFGNITGSPTYSLIDLKTKNFYLPVALDRAGSSGQITISSKYGFKISISKELIFARLQIFSRPELFGLTYYILIFGLLYWWRKIKKTPMDQVMFWGLFFMAAPIIYKFYLNRRYILTTLPMAIYFGALSLGSYYETLKKNKKEKWVWIIVFSLVLVIIGAYFASSSISSATISSKGKSSKLQYLLSSKYEQDKLISSDIFAAIDFINQETPPDSIILTYDNGRYYYFGQRKAIYWHDPAFRPFYNSGNINESTFSNTSSIDDSTFFNSSSIDESLAVLKGLGIDYFMIDQTYSQECFFFKSYLKDLVADPQYSQKVFDGETKVYQIK